MALPSSVSVSSIASALDARGVRRSFGSTIALAGVDLSVAPGEVVGLVGPNGAGKTTLIRCIAGLLQMEAGSSAIGGFDVVRQHPEAMRQLGFVPETPHPIPNLTPFEHLLFVAKAFSLPDGWQARARETLAALDLADLGDRLAGELSKGQQQKVHLSMVMLRNPNVVILDEPLIGLDPKAAHTLKAWTRARVAAGGAVLLSSHSLGFIEELCQRVVVLNAGSVLATGTIAALRERTRLATGTPFEEVFLKITAG